MHIQIGVYILAANINRCHRRYKTPTYIRRSVPTNFPTRSSFFWTRIAIIIFHLINITNWIVLGQTEFIVSHIKGWMVIWKFPHTNKILTPTSAHRSLRYTFIHPFSRDDISKTLSGHQLCGREIKERRVLLIILPFWDSMATKKWSDYFLKIILVFTVCE